MKRAGARGTEARNDEGGQEEREKTDIWYCVPVLRCERFEPHEGLLDSLSESDAIPEPKEKRMQQNCQPGARKDISQSNCSQKTFSTHDKA